MNVTEHLLSVLGEECAEVAQRCSKASRFGIHEIQQSDASQTLNNAERIHEEMQDLIAVFEMLVSAGVLPLTLNRDAINAKKEKVEKYMRYAREIGTLHD